MDKFTFSFALRDKTVKWETYAYHCDYAFKVFYRQFPTAERVNVKMS